jgi:hypothetical protein
MGVSLKGNSFFFLIIIICCFLKFVGFKDMDGKELSDEVWRRRNDEYFTREDLFLEAMWLSWGHNGRRPFDFNSLRFLATSSSRGP